VNLADDLGVNPEESEIKTEGAVQVEAENKYEEQAIELMPEFQGDQDEDPEKTIQELVSKVHIDGEKKDDEPKPKSMAEKIADNVPEEDNLLALGTQSRAALQAQAAA
jgi:hypothetical protein